MPTHYNGNDQEKRALDLFITLSRASDTLFKSAEKVYKKYNIKAGGFGVLEMLYHLGPMCQKEVSEKLLSTEGNITQICSTLEKNELIIREKSQPDKRFIILNLTDKGKSLIEKAFVEYLDNLVLDVSILSKEEQLSLIKICKKLGKAIT